MAGRLSPHLRVHVQIGRDLVPPHRDTGLHERYVVHKSISGRLDAIDFIMKLRAILLRLPRQPKDRFRFLLHGREFLDPALQCGYATKKLLTIHLATSKPGNTPERG
jgi:hypothetical protein